MKCAQILNNCFRVFWLFLEKTIRNHYIHHITVIKHCHSTYSTIPAKALNSVKCSTQCSERKKWANLQKISAISEFEKRAYSSGRGQVVKKYVISVAQRPLSQHWNIESPTVSIHEGNSSIAVGQWCIGENGPAALTAPHWSALIRSKCTLPILIHCQYWHEVSNWQEHCDPHARVQVSISAMPAATHLHVSVTINWTALNITCVCWISWEDMSFYFEFYPRLRGMAYNYMQMKAALIKHVPRGCSIIFERLQLFRRFKQM